MFGLLDGNNFFVSCERVFRPDLSAKPVVVLSNNDGCIIARSQEVKDLGIKMGVPFFKVKRTLEQHDVKVFSSNFSLYADMSHRMMSLIESFVPAVEIYSIDEAFLDLSEIPNLQETAKEIRHQVLKYLGLPTCIGVAPTKTLAKIANHLAKKDPSYKGLCILNTPQKIDSALKALDISDVWGVGYRLAGQLRSYGIYSAWNLKNVDPKWMRRHFTVVGERMILELRGIPCSKIEEEREGRHSIQVSRSFSHKITDFQEMRQAVATYATRLGEKLRQHNLKARLIGVSIRTSFFNPQEKNHRQHILLTAPSGINDDINLIKVATEGLKQIFRPGYPYYKAALLALDLIPENPTQLLLFDCEPSPSPRHAALFEVVDTLNQRYGRGTVHSAACGKKLTWKDRKEKKSPSYTTSWKNLPVVRA